MEHLPGPPAFVPDADILDERFHCQESMLALHTIGAQTLHALSYSILQLFHRAGILAYRVLQRFLEIVTGCGVIEEWLFVPGTFFMFH